MAGLAAGIAAITSCAAGPVVVSQRPQSSTARPTVPASSRPPPAPNNEKKTWAEANRLLGLVVPPPGSVKLDRNPSSILSSPAMGIPGSNSLVDVTTFWRVPLSTTATLSWFTYHPPANLTWGGAGGGSNGTAYSSGYSYNAPEGAAWVNALVDVSVAAEGPNVTILRGDGMALWLDPTPYPDNQPGPRMHFTVATGCPASDHGVVGVTNPPPALDTSLLPAESPVAGVACQYYGMNTKPYTLKQITRLGVASAEQFAAKARRLRVAHTDDGVHSCPREDGSVTAVALAYPDGSSIDLWMTGGCAGTANGYIRVDGSVAL